MIPILGALGCPYTCSYCPYPLGFGTEIIHNYPESIADEIEYLNQLGVDYFLFRNQCFTYNKKWSKNVCSEINKRGLDVEWICEARVDEVSKDILQYMWDAGCRRILFGVETGHPSLINKAKPGSDLQHTQKAFKLSKEMGFFDVQMVQYGDHVFSHEISAIGFWIVRNVALTMPSGVNEYEPVVFL